MFCSGAAQTEILDPLIPIPIPLPAFRHRASRYFACIDNGSCSPLSINRSPSLDEHLRQIQTVQKRGLVYFFEVVGYENLSHLVHHAVPQILLRVLQLDPHVVNDLLELTTRSAAPCAPATASRLMRVGSRRFALHPLTSILF